MSKPRKPSRGVCQICGAPVVAPSDSQVHEGTINGHVYVADQRCKGGIVVGIRYRLLQVRCPRCGGHGFPPGANHVRHSANGLRRHEHV
jgi:hypothetical protein